MNAVLPSPLFARWSRCLTLVTLAALAWLPAQAVAAPVTGNYDNEGSMVQVGSAYDGAVSLAALLGLELDYKLGALHYAEVARVDIEQTDRTFTVRFRNKEGQRTWTGKWECNGGYEPTADGAKIVLHSKKISEDAFIFTFSTIKENAALYLEVVRMQSGALGPTTKQVGSYIFLKAAAR